MQSSGKYRCLLSDSSLRKLEGEELLMGALNHRRDGFVLNAVMHRDIVYVCGLDDISH